MKQLYKYMLAIGFIFILFSCASKKIMKETYLLPRYPIKKAIQVKSENVRDEANGEIIGTLKKGDSILVLNKSGNWVEFDYYPDEKGYIWGPSLGFDYINLYHPYIYVDSTDLTFISLMNLNHILGQVPDTIETVGNLSHLKYKNLGLGKRMEEILNVAKLEKKLVEKTVKVWINNQTKNIIEVQIDLFRPVKGKESALKKAGLNKNLQVLENSESKTVVNLGKKNQPMIMTLKRKEWKSNYFIGYSISYK